MQVRLISITKPVAEELKDFSTEDLVAYCARVSNPSNQMNTETSQKLLKYCADNSHWSIFEMVNLCFEIKTTRDIGRQILRHKTGSFQEFSQRYQSVDDTSFEVRECRLQDSKNRQSSITLDTDNPKDFELSEWWEDAQQEVIKVCSYFYKTGLEKGIAKEQCRALLPEGLTMSTLYFNATLRTVIHYCNVRCHDSTQKEHRLVAEKIREITIQNFPSLSGII